MFKSIALVIALLVAAVLIYAGTKPDTFTLQRSATIGAPPDKVFALINDVKAFNTWNPFARKDPAAKLQYQGAAKYMTETGQAYIFSIAMLSKRWFDGLPPDLQGIVMATAKQAGAEAIPWSLDFLVAQRKAWAEKGGEVIALPAADRAEMMAKLASVGDDIVKTKPELKPLWDQMVATAKRGN